MSEAPVDEFANESVASNPPPLMIHVRAPATLPGGYTFEAEINGDPKKTFTCEVPEGGIEEGVLFLAPLPSDYKRHRLNVPTGQWKDGLFDCFSIGIFHKSVCCAIFFQQLLLGQVMQRMSLTWLGEPGPRVATLNTFRIVLVLFISYFAYSTALQLADSPYEDGEAPYFTSVLKGIGSFAFTFWSFYSLCRTRENARARFSIEEEYCIGCEDVCCSVFCSCCAVAQLARHTGEYETYEAKCCTTSGLPIKAPFVV